MKNKILSTIDNCREDIIAIGEEVLRHPELGFKEFKTAEVVKREFAKLDLDFRCELAVTGVKATVKIDDTPINVCVIGEMDAVKCYENPYADPITGAAHACGHNAQIATMLGTAMGLLKSGALSEMHGKVTFFAVPAEEFVELEYRQMLKNEGKITYLSGKQELIELGEFDDIDIAMMVHSQASGETPDTYIGGTSLGFVAKQITIKGKPAHGSAPFEGINALNGAMLALMGINANRETFRDEDKVRIHPIITNGGDLVNVVPERAVIETYVRAANPKAIEDACKKVDNAARAGAMAVGAECEISDIPGYMPLMQDETLDRIFAENAIPFVGEEQIKYGVDMTGSTDMGDLSLRIPSIQPTMGGFAGAAHGKDFLIVNKEAAYIYPAKAMACTVYDLLKDNAALARKIKSEFIPKV